MYRNRNEVVLLKNATSTTQSNACPVSDYETMTLNLATSGTTTATIKVVGSCSAERPDFSQASSKTNKWAYVSVRDIEDGTNIDGTTGIALTSDVCNNYLVNTTGLRRLGVVVSAYTAGSIDVEMSGFTL